MLIEEHFFALILTLFVRPVSIVQESTFLIFFLFRMKLDLQAGLAVFSPLSLDKARGCEDVVKGADKTLVQTLATNKAKPGGEIILMLSTKQITEMVETLPFAT